MTTFDWINGQPAITDTTNYDWVGGLPYIFTEIVTTATTVITNLRSLLGVGT